MHQARQHKSLIRTCRKEPMRSRLYSQDCFPGFICRLFVSETTLINSGESEKNTVTSYNLTYSPSSGASISDAISSELWSESPNRFFSSLANVLPISITRTARNVWGDINPLLLEDHLYMGEQSLLFPAHSSTNGLLSLSIRSFHG